MKVKIASLLFLTGFLPACHDHDDPDPVKTPATRTVIVYMMAENSLYRYTSSDSTEMAAATGKIPQDVNFVLFKDDRRLPVIYSLSAQKGVQKWKGYDKDRDSADSTFMRNTLQEIVRCFPAQHYGLVLWSHGTGWIPQTDTSRKKTIGIDNNENSSENTGTKMEISELAWALKDVAHFEYILFDACLMQSIEVLYQLRHVTDAAIGSPAEIPANGAPYDLVMDGLCQGNIPQIINSYFSAYENGSGVALSAINCQKLDSFAIKTAPFIQKVWNEKKTVSTEDIQYYAPFSYGNYWNPEPFDMRSAMHHLLSEEDFRVWDEALQDIIIECRSTSYWTSVFSGYHNYLFEPAYYSGISMFIPNPKYNSYGWNQAFQTTDWYRDAGWKTTGW